MNRTVRLFGPVLLLFIALCVFGAISVTLNQPLEYGDTLRYWFPEGAIGAFNLGPNQGAVLPSLLFSGLDNTFLSFVAQTAVWCFAWSLCFAYWDYFVANGRGVTRWLVVPILFGIATSNAVFDWNSQLLTESLGLSFLALTISTIFSMGFRSIGRVGPQNRILQLLILFTPILLLSLTKPAWALMLLPLILTSLIYNANTSRNWLNYAITCILGFAIILEFKYTQAQTYTAGLSFQQWFTLTRAMDLSSIAGLPETYFQGLLDCPNGSAFTSWAAAGGLSGSMPPEYPQLIANCPSLSSWLSSDPNGIFTLLSQNPRAFIRIVVERLPFLTQPYPAGMRYGSVAFRGISLAEIPPAIVQIFFMTTTAVTLLVTVIYRQWRLLLFFALNIILAFTAFAIYVMQDGLEKQRHVVSVIVWVMLSFLFTLATAFRLSKLRADTGNNLASSTNS